MAAGVSWKASLYEISAKVPRRKKLRHPERRRAEDVSGWKDSVEPESKDLRGLDAEVHLTASGHCQSASGRLGMERAKFVSVIPGKNNEVLRLRSGPPAEASKAFRRAPLRMTERGNNTFAETSSSLTIEER
jgi:hypothetical protein